ncbi:MULTISPECIES: hypothetical protein [Capnocytophaga]|uniref:Uncharacterized protein n=3 Tax=Capnocytophaga TaxID=1016 RepID=A0ABU5YDE4_9FLAO|nr:MULTISPECIES: hypothetical protein [Capnocytophaga]MEB3013254.1 hypothetical protein [Capnocytophaga gingivalis]MEB3041972.1 hypothetical protein [Capnocytophaga gingivalis]
MPKSDKNTIERRIKSISSMLINGNNREFIVLYCSENWNIGERQADKYISKARTLIEQSVKKQVAYDYAKAVRRYEELYRLSIEKKDYKTALSVNKELTTLQGLFKIEVEHSGNIEFICNIPD